MGIEGGLNIALKPGAERQVVIGSNRPVHASRLFHGRAAGDVLRMVPMVFSIGGTAQACAAVRACEQAMGVAPAPAVEVLRETLVRLETVREHLWRILLDWPGFVGETPLQNGMAEMVAIQREWRDMLTGEGDPFIPGGGAAKLDVRMSGDPLRRLREMLAQSVFGVSTQQWLEIETPDALSVWAQSGVTVAARLLDRVMSRDWGGVGRCGVEALPVLESEPLHESMQEDAFIKRPQWLGKCYETSSFTRVDSPLLDRLRARYGNGLLVRLTARLSELAQLAEGLAPRSSSYRAGGEPGVGNTGIGRVTAVRGELLHSVTLEEKSASAPVLDYRIVAPTEWNFHPQGVVAASLATLAGEADVVAEQARLLINAIDPCVAYELRIA